MTMESVPFEKRCQESRRILEKYADRVPVICDRLKNSELPQIEKTKFLVPGVMVCHEFKYIIHKHINQRDAGERHADQTIYLFVNNTAPKASALMSEIYEEKKSEDGFLYMTYSAENTLGDECEA